jgi:hypothetical protein
MRMRSYLLHGETAGQGIHGLMLSEQLQETSYLSLTSYKMENLFKNSIQQTS